jgi:glycosyltransferase involved in cell wall biosynthesis
MTILVAIPYFGCPELVERAVRSILAQSYRDLHLVVIGDGDTPPLAGILDSRLEVYVLPENRGPYFAQQVALLASPHALYAPHAADDWSDPDHLERLLAVAGEAVITGAVWWHQGDTVKIHEASYEVGLFATSRLLALGGHNPAERMGQDTLLIRLLRMTGETRATHYPTYHRVKRPGSLMTAPLTRPGSALRNEMRARNRVIYARAGALGSIDAIRRMRQELVPPTIAAEVDEHAARLSTRLGQKAVA